MSIRDIMKDLGESKVENKGQETVTVNINDLIATLAMDTNSVESSVQSDELVIDSNLRDIRIPSAIKNLGVENDHNIKRLKFRMPRYYGEVDLSTFDIRINYINAKAEGDVYAVVDKTVIGEDITFSWLVGKTATKYKGDTQFIVCMKITDDTGAVQQEFNTTIANLTVLKGLETGSRIVTDNADILEQVLKAMTGQIEPADIGVAVAKYMEEHKDEFGGNVDTSGFATKEEVNQIFGEKFDKSGHAANKYLGTDKNGNVVEKDVPQNDVEIENGSVTADKLADGVIPEKLPSPNALKLNINGTTYTYDGSGSVIVEVNMENSGSAEIARIEKNAADTSAILDPNVLYVFPEMSSLTINLGDTNNAAVSEYHFIFRSGATATTLALPEVVVLTDGFKVDANKVYEISILENLLTYQSWAVS